MFQEELVKVFQDPNESWNWKRHLVYETGVVWFALTVGAWAPSAGGKVCSWLWSQQAPDVAFVFMEDHFTVLIGLRGPQKTVAPGSHEEKSCLTTLFC